MNEILTNEWYKSGEKHPPAGREVLCQMVGDYRRTAIWNGFYWVDPRKKTKLPVTEIVYKWYMYEKPGSDE